MATGQTKDAGWQIGVSRTVDRPAAAVWDLLTGPEGVSIWLGPGVSLNGAAGQTYRTDDGTAGEVRSFRPLDRVRLTYRPAGWDHETTVQIAIQDKGPKTALRFHQERLADGEERERQRTHWKRIADELAKALDATSGTARP